MKPVLLNGRLVAPFRHGGKPDRGELKDMDWYFETLKKYAVFDGRARRKEYWYFFLFNVIICLMLAFVATELYMVYGLAVLLPGIGVAIRRLHDTDRSGWWLLIGFIPLIGNVVLLVVLLFDSDPGDNRYGSNPKLA